MTLKIKIPIRKDDSNKEHEKALNLMREIRTDMMEQGFLHFLDSLKTPPGSPFGFRRTSAAAPVSPLAAPASLEVAAPASLVATPASPVAALAIPVVAASAAIHRSGSSSPKVGISPKAAAIPKPILKKSLSWNENLEKIILFS